MKDEQRVLELFAELKTQMTSPGELKVLEDCQITLNQIKDLSGEVWRDIIGYEGRYQVSNFGRVKSFHGGKITLLKQSINRKYLRVCLAKNILVKIYLFTF